MGPVIGAIILVVVMVVAGLGVYFALPSSSTSSGLSGTTHYCQGTCPTPGIKHDAKVTSPFETSQAGGLVPFTASISSGIPSSFTFWFGDGTSVTTSAASVTHTFTSPGQFYVYVQVTDTSGVVHDNLRSLFVFTSTPTYSGDPLGDHVQTGGKLLANGSSSTSPTAVVPAGGSVTVSGWQAGTPATSSTTVTSISFTAENSASAPGSDLTIATPTGAAGGVGSSQANPLTSKVTVASSAPTGDYGVNFTVATSLVIATGTVSAWSNYTFSIFVFGSGSNSAAPQIVSYPKPPNPGTITSYELVPGGGVTTDPSIDYETAGAEVIYNVYQTLITYNGSQAGPAPQDFVPELSTCVPGSTVGADSCVAQYGSTLVTNNGGTFTFPINPNSRFYNPYSSDGLPQSYQVWPSDVVWSLARTCLYADFPGEGSNPGWIQCQALLPFGSESFDNGLHYPFDSTPANILSAITVNSSACPAAAMHASGCVTFNTSASGASWPEFLELLADPDGGAIQSCIWDQTQGWTLPGWTVCGQPPYSSPPSDTAWDAAEQTGSPTSWNVKLSTQMVGSGPYYLAAYSPGQSYALKINPDYGGTTCPTPLVNGCMPSAGGSDITAKLVSVTWEKTQTPGEAAYAAGTADQATVPATDTPTLLEDLSKGEIGAIVNPTLDLFFTSFNMGEAQGLAQRLTTVNLTAPTWMMQDLNMRQFLINAFPYGVVQNQFCTIDGIEYCILYGGAIPHDMGTFYPTNITWPSGTPNSNPSVQGGAAWWWAQVQADNMLGTGAPGGAVCTSIKPCTYPLVISAGDPFDLAIYTDWQTSIEKLSGDAIEPVIIQINFATLVSDLYSPPGAGGFSSFFLGWLPDYPDPSDYTVPMFYPDSTYTDTTGWGETMYCTPGTTAPSGVPCLAVDNYQGTCPGLGPVPTSVTNACQGSAYQELVTLTEEGNACAPPTCSNTQRTLLFNMAEQIENELGMYTWEDQTVGVGSYASWISPTSFNPNPTTPGFIWWDWLYQDQALNPSGLP